MKIKSKITALFVLLVTAILLLLSFSVYYFTALERESAFNQRLRSRANNNAQIFSLFDNADSSRMVLTQIDSSTSYLPQKSIGIYNYLNESVYSFHSPDASPFEVSPDILNQARIKQEVYFHSGNRDALAFYHTDNSSRIVVVVAAYDSDGWNRLRQLRDLLLICLFAGIGLTLLVGFIFSRQLVKPIQQIIHEVNEISSHNLSHRLHAGSSQDELNQLAGTFNELLNRLQESFAIQRRFISNASHELSTPLTSIKSQLEVTLHIDRDTREYKQVLNSILEDVQQMQQLTKSLLEIAKTGSQGSIELSEVRIDEVLFKIMADVMKVNPAYIVNLHFGEFPDDEKTYLVFGNYELLYSAIRNIVENGCKYSPDHSTDVELNVQQQDIVINVKNQGDVIAEEEIDNIFQPFYRISSTADIKGFGLGLALARRIISLHKGHIAVQSDVATGTVFTIGFPSFNSFATP